MQRRLVRSSATPSIAHASGHFDLLLVKELCCRRYYSGSSGLGDAGRAGGQLHNYVRDYDKQQSSRDHDKQRHSPAGGHAPLSHGGGRPSVMREYSDPGVGEDDGQSWKSQLYRELLVETDSLGGMAHKDYYRDPAQGYSPQYAPRNFAKGGELDYPHMSSPLEYTVAQAQREWLQHDVDDLAGRAQQARAAMRAAAPNRRTSAASSAAATAAESVSWMQHRVYPPHASRSTTQSQQRSGATLDINDRYHRSGANHYNSSSNSNQRPDIAQADALASSAAIDVMSQLRNFSGEGMSAARRREQVTLDRFQAMALAAPASELAGTLPADELQEHVHGQLSARQDESLAEGMRIAHGLRARERHEFTIMQRTARIPFDGYDMDRFAAQQRGRPYAALQMPPAIPACTVAEAQKNVRAPASASSSSSPSPPPSSVVLESVAKEVYARNTVSDAPQLDGALTESIVAGVSHTRQSQKAHMAQRRQQRFGLGRQGGLVQDGGPDQRTIVKHRNDARLVDALRFSSDAYRHTLSDEHVNPYIRRDTAHGVGHLLTNHFDVSRRADRLARQLPDLTERQTIHYGVPVQQTIDEFVLRHRNARAERPLDYFKPFPDFRAQRLSRVYRDVEGFALLRQKPETLEWELFMRYRAHHQQRRALALLHGLEPVCNETASERAARRAALDRLCERSPFDAKTFLVAQDDETVVDAETLRSWFGVYMLPSPSVVTAIVGPDAGSNIIISSSSSSSSTGATSQTGNSSLDDTTHSASNNHALANTNSNSSRSRSVHAGGGQAAATAVNIHIQHLHDELGTPDTREHVLSARYLNKLFAFEGYQQRVHRHYVHETLGRAPEPVIAYAQPDSVLRRFSAEERAMYERYVHSETHRQLDHWARMQRGRRWLAEKGMYGVVVRQGTPMRVMDGMDAESGAVVSICMTRYAAEIAAAQEAQRVAMEQEEEQEQQQRQKQTPIASKSDSAHDAKDHSASSSVPSSSLVKRTRDHVRRVPPLARIRLADDDANHKKEEDGDEAAEYVLLAGTERTVVPLSIRLDSGELFDTTAEDFSQCPLEESASSAYNHALSYGVADYSYNRANYVETQDVLWERATAAGTEGWSPATHADGLRAGLPVRARRAVASLSVSTLQPAHLRRRTQDASDANGASTTRNEDGTNADHHNNNDHNDNNSDTMDAMPSCDYSCSTNHTQWSIAGHAASDALVMGEYQRGYIVRYDTQPFFNPEPRVVWIRFARDGAVEQVPLSDVLIWQRRYHGPERTVADTTRRFNRAGLRRYIDVADPHGEKSKYAEREGVHFLDKYDTQRGARDVAAAPDMSTVKQSDEIDRWTAHDSRRADNYRPLSISHRRDYVRQNYLPRYTPWEWIAIQEADQPVIAETIRRDDLGPSYFFSLNRYWRYKARPHGYVRHFEHEVRDLLQYVDGVTPWKQAQKIRTYWEVREHHPMPQFNRPEVAMHRNTPALLPTHLWETDKKTAKVKSVKDSVRDYQTKTPLPKWVQL